MRKLLAALAVVLGLSGCYPLALNASSYTKPISFTGSVGRPARVLRHFEYDVITWYLLGAYPVATLPGTRDPWVPADRLVLALLERELGPSGDGVINLRVSQRMTPKSVALIAVPSLAIALIPHMPPWVGGVTALLFQPIAVKVEGDVIALGGQAELPSPGLRRTPDGRVEAEGLDLPRAIAEAR